MTHPRVNPWLPVLLAEYERRERRKANLIVGAAIITFSLVLLAIFVFALIALSTLPGGTS